MYDSYTLRSAISQFGIGVTQHFNWSDEEDADLM